MNNTVNIKAAKYEPPVLIHYVQGSTEIPLEFNITDYEIPSGSTARIYIKRPDNTESYNDCTISGNVITYKPTAQFFSVAGICTGQLQIMIGDDFLVTFPLLFDVAENIIDDSAIESSNEYGALESLLQEAQENIPAAGEAAEAANQAAQSANTAANAANTAATKANAAKNVANSAASSAATAAGQASTAARSANTAASSANNAAAAANEAAQDAQEIVETANDRLLPATGPLSISKGGTGGTTQLEAADSLGVPSLVNGTAIAKNTDLNTVVEIGNYKCTVIPTVATLKNCPTTQTFKLYVENTALFGGGDYRTQTIIDIDGTVYTRYTANLGTSWTAWKYLDGMTDDEYEQLYTALGLSVE